MLEPGEVPPLLEPLPGEARLWQLRVPPPGLPVRPLEVLLELPPVRPVPQRLARRREWPKAPEF